MVPALNRRGWEEEERAPPGISRASQQRVKVCEPLYAATPHPTLMEGGGAIPGEGQLARNRETLNPKVKVRTPRRQRGVAHRIDKGGGLSSQLWSNS